MGKNPCRKNTVSEKVLHGRYNEVYSLKVCKYLIFKQLGNINFQKKDSKFKGRMLFFCIKKKRTKRKIYISLLYFFNALQVELVVEEKRLG